MKNSIGLFILAAAGLAGGLLLGLLIRARLASAPSPSGEHASHAPAPAVAEETVRRKTKPDAGKLHDIANTNCPIMGGQVDEGSFWLVYDGLLVGFCCPGCDEEFLEDPVRHLSALKEAGAAVPEEALDPARHPPLVDAQNEQCPIRGNPVGDSEVYVVHRGLAIHLCCPPCRSDFAEDPDAGLEKVARDGANVPADRLKEGR